MFTVLLLTNIFNAVVIESYNYLVMKFKRRKAKVVTIKQHQILIQPSSVHRRYRLDLDIEESRREMQQEEVVRRQALGELNAQIENRVQSMQKMMDEIETQDEIARHELEAQMQRDREQRRKRASEMPTFKGIAMTLMKQKEESKQGRSGEEGEGRDDDGSNGSNGSDGSNGSNRSIVVPQSTL